jgi:hypothetical protein
VILDIVAPGSIDLALMGYADGKTCLSDRFLMSEAKLRQVYQQITAPDSDDEEDLGLEPEPSRRKATKVATRKRKQSPIDSSEVEVSEGEVSGKATLPQSKPRKRAKATGSDKTGGPMQVKDAAKRKAQPAASGSEQQVSKLPS